MQYELSRIEKWAWNAGVGCPHVEPNSASDSVAAVVILARSTSGKERRELLVAAAKLYYSYFKVRKGIIYGMAVATTMWYDIAYA